MAEERVRRSPEIEAVFRRLWRAFVDGSEAAFSNLMSSDAGFRMILSADDQWRRPRLRTHVRRARQD